MPEDSDSRRGDPPPRKPITYGGSSLYKLARAAFFLAVALGLGLLWFFMERRISENGARADIQEAEARAVSAKLGDACLDRGTVELCLAFCADKAPNPEACRGRMWDRWIREQKP